MAFVHALHLSCNNYTITTKLKKVKTNNNIEMQDECFSGQGERGRWGGGGEGICQKKMPITAWVPYGPQNLQHRYTCTYISACTCYAGSKCFSLGAIFFENKFITQSSYWVYDLCYVCQHLSNEV